MEFCRQWVGLTASLVRRSNVVQGIITNRSRQYAVKKPDLDVKKPPKYVMEIETDAHKLVNYVCGTRLLEAEENIKIKPDSEYPDWLWKLYTGRPLRLHEMDPNTLQYWRRVRRLGRRMKNIIRSYHKEKMFRK